MKVKFEFQWGFNQIEEEIFEFDDDITEEEIEEKYQFWLWESVIGDKVGWKIIEE